jgi:hypothetical protein
VSLFVVLLVASGAVPLLAGAYRRLVKELEAGQAHFDDPQFRTIPFADFPGWVQRGLGPLREQFAVLGLRELLSYTRRSDRLNYTTVLLSSDGHVVCHVWVGRSRGLMRWTWLFFGWAAIKREFLSQGRYGLITHFPGERRLETSPVELLARAHEPDVWEQHTVPPGASLEEAMRLHAGHVAAFAARVGCEPRPVLTEPEFFAPERACVLRVGARLRRQQAQMRNG